jgi:hypothetical protein
MDIEVLRLTPGTDLRDALDGFTRERGFASGFIVSAVGSLRAARLRFAGRSEATAYEGDLEIVALSGTLSPDGCHLHAALADEKGALIGGHVLAGCVVRTTAELVIGVSNAHRFTRELDPATGFRELVVHRVPGSS